MRLIRTTLALLMLAGPAAAGDPEGLDPAVFDQCLAQAGTEGARIDCAGKGVASCKAFWAGRKHSFDDFTVLSACTDDEQQLWGARLEASYKALIASTEASHPEEVEAVRAMERAWIAFRDARCAAERGLFGHGTGGAIAVPECMLKETARQYALLTELQESD